MPKIVKGTKAGAEVVERETAAQPAQLIHHALSFVDVGDARGFGDIEYDTARVDAESLQLALDEIRHAGIGEGAAGEIDREAGQPGMQGQQFDGALDDPTIEHVNLPGLLHRGDDDARRDDADRLLGVETQQRLEVIDLAGGHLAYRLYIKLEAVFRERLTHPMGPIDVVAQRVVVPVVGGVDVHQIAAAAFGNEAGLVGLQQMFGARGLAAVDEADADAAADRGVTVALGAIVVEHLDEAGRHRHRLIHVCLYQLQRDLVPANAAQLGG